MVDAVRDGRTCGSTNNSTYLRKKKKDLQSRLPEIRKHPADLVPISENRDISKSTKPFPVTSLH